MGLTKTYGSVTAVAGLSMSVPRGEVFGFLGPNGAGKTTAVKLLLGLARPTSGTATVLGAPAGAASARRRIGYLPELFRYQSWLSAYEVLVLHCHLARIPKSRMRRHVERALVTVGLAERAHDRVGTFSKGMQQRLGLGVALLGNPEVVFLDEPTSALDPVGRKDVRDIIRHLRDLRDQGRLWPVTMGGLTAYCEAREQTELGVERDSGSIRISVKTRYDVSRFGETALTLRVPLARSPKQAVARTGKDVVPISGRLEAEGNGGTRAYLFDVPITAKDVEVAI